MRLVIEFGALAVWTLGMFVLAFSLVYLAVKITDVLEVYSGHIATYPLAVGVWLIMIVALGHLWYGWSWLWRNFGVAYGIRRHAQRIRSRQANR